ncbi:MAG: RNA methyltransferase [Bacteroidales bacterium]|nr:RNA methyltransferase [Bacteroidales bacterium]
MNPTPTAKAAPQPAASVPNPIVEIRSLDHPLLSPYARLTEAQLRNRLHAEQGLFICESAKVIRIALTAGVEPCSMLCERKFLPQAQELLGGTPWREVPILTADSPLLHQLTGYELSRGLLAAMRRPALPLADEVLCSAHRVAVLDGVVNSENTGAIFRAAAALGMDAVLLTRTSCDPLNRRACRVSMGTIFQLPWAYLDSYVQLSRAGFTTVALALTDRALPLDHPSLRGHQRLALILGSEGDGLSPEALHSCQLTARIPMWHGVDSLNVAAAAAVAFYALADTDQR